ncbi:MAG: hypothetical protein NC416_03560 [Eubacterium sp.]|nr:hypothetical protein [Eubacterium sp.]
MEDTSKRLCAFAGGDMIDDAAKAAAFGDFKRKKILHWMTKDSIFMLILEV